MKLKSINPSNNKVLGEVEVSTKKEILKKISNAHKVQSDWNKLGVGGRVKILRKVVDNVLSGYPCFFKAGLQSSLKLVTS